MLRVRKRKCDLAQVAVILCHRKFTTKVEMENVDGKVEDGESQI
jgi:hypothetical protein